MTGIEGLVPSQKCGREKAPLKIGVDVNTAREKWVL